MKDIDFLPQWYKLSRRRRDSRRTRLWLGAVGLSVLLIWFTTGHLRLREAKAQLAQLDSYHSTLQEGLDIIDQLNVEQSTLLERHELARQLTPKLSCVRILSRLAQLIPPQVSIERLHWVTAGTQTSTPPQDKISALADRIADQNNTGQKTRQQETELHLSIFGLAPSVMDAAVFVGQLVTSQDFRDVRLEYCNAVKIEDRKGCRFKVSFLIRPPLALALKQEDTPQREVTD